MGEHLTGVEFVVGVDTHKASYTAAVVSRAGAELETLEVASDAFGHKRLLAFARCAGDGPRLWAIEGTGSFGRGLTTYLLEQGEAVAEIDRPARPARRNGAKTDALDATRAAREALARPHVAQPRRRGTREALRVLVRTRTTAVRAKSVAICHLKSLIGTAPGALRDQLRHLSDVRLAPKCARLRTTLGQSPEHRATIQAIRATARRILFLVAPRAGAVRGRLRPDGGRRADPGLVGPDYPASAQSLRRSSPQLRPAPDHPRAPDASRGNQGLRRAAYGGRPESARDQTLPETLPRPTALPPHGGQRHPPLTDIEASSPSVSRSPPRRAAGACTTAPRAT
jgi:Transposase